MTRMASPIEERFDEMLMSIAPQVGGMDGLLKCFFGFLHRRTDFYAVIPKGAKQSKLGFEEGKAEKMVLQAFTHFPFKTIDGSQLQHSSIARKMNEEARQKNKRPEATAKGKKPSSSRENTTLKAVSNKRSGATQSRDPAPDKKVESGIESTKIPSGNGGFGKNYEWHQTLSDLTVFAKLRKETPSKEIACRIQPRHLSIGIKGESPIIEGEIPESWSVNPTESFWTWEKDKGILTVSLDKKEETWWPSVVVGEPEIDTQLVDSTRHISEYDDKTQATIRKIVHDQNQKRS